MKFVITQRSEDGTSYYTGGRFAGWAFEIGEAKLYTTKKIAQRKAREINRADEAYYGEKGTAAVREV